MEYNGISTFKKTYNRNGLFFMPTLEVGNQVSGPESPVSSLGVPLLLQGSMQPSGQQQEGPNGPMAGPAGHAQVTRRVDNLVEAQAEAMALPWDRV